MDFGAKVGGRFRYYVDPRFRGWGLEERYISVMDSLFETYRENIPVLADRLKDKHHDVKEDVVEKKAFDVFRSILPLSTLAQVAFNGNAQAFKYLIDRCAQHPVGELRWSSRMQHAALKGEADAFLLRQNEKPTLNYQDELHDRRKRVGVLADTLSKKVDVDFHGKMPFEVHLLEYDPDGENKILAGLLYDAGDSRQSWSELLRHVHAMSDDGRRAILDAHFEGREYHWQKVGRALENTFLRFEIVMNAGAYRDLHRHRMHTQERQRFTTHLGFSVPPELEEFGLDEIFCARMRDAHELFCEIEERDVYAAQYAVPMAYLMRFYQYQNMREFFKEVELRTGPDGHPDYRWVEQQKFLLVQDVYPNICEWVKVDLNKYDLARRSMGERQARKEQRIAQQLGGSSS